MIVLRYIGNLIGEAIATVLCGVIVVASLILGA